MRTFAVIAALTGLTVGSAAGVVVLRRAPTDTAMTADIERDLQIAARTPSKRTGVVSALEQGRPGAPSGQSRGQRMVVPTTKRAPKAAPSRSVMDAPTDVSAEVPETVPAPVVSEPVAVVASAAESATDASATPPDNSYPTPAEGPSAGTGTGNQRGSGGMGSGGGGMRTGSVIGAIAGAIIRGASAGHDHCEPGPRRRGGVSGGTLGTIGGVLIRR